MKSLTLRWWAAIQMDDEILDLKPPVIEKEQFLDDKKEMIKAIIKNKTIFNVGCLFRVGVMNVNCHLRPKQWRTLQMNRELICPWEFYKSVNNIGLNFMYMFLHRNVLEHSDFYNGATCCNRLMHIYQPEINFDEKPVMDIYMQTLPIRSTLFQVNTYSR